MNIIEKFMIKWDLKKQSKKLSSADCNAENLKSIYGSLMRYAQIYQDNPKFMSEIFQILSNTVKHPKNDAATYKNALLCAQLYLNASPKLTSFTADLYKNISEKYGDISLITSLNGFIKTSPHAVSVAIDCIKNVHNNNLASQACSDGSADFFRSVIETNNSSSIHLKALDGMLSVAKNKNDDKSSDDTLAQTMYNLDILVQKKQLKTLEEILKVMEIAKVGLVSKHKNSFIYSTQVLDKIIDQHPDMAQEVFKTLQSGMKKNMDSYKNPFSMNLTSDILIKIGNADSSLAEKVTNIEKSLHPNKPKFKFSTVDDEQLLTHFIYYPSGELLAEHSYKNGKEHGIQRTITKDGGILSEESYKNGMKDGLEVKYGAKHEIIGVLVYNNGTQTNTCLALNAPIKKLNNGVFLQQRDKEAFAVYPDGFAVHINAKNNTLSFAEKDGVAHNFSGQIALKICKHLATIKDSEQKMIELQKYCRKQAQNENIGEITKDVGR